ncbi:Protein PSK SIMULATOR 1 [Linum grandiflorum]
MAPLETKTWLIKAVKSAINLPRSKPTKTIGILSFEIASLMTKLLHLWQSLSDKNVIRLKNDSISLHGVRKIVSNDESFLLGLACAELAENLRLVAKSVSRIAAHRCSDGTHRRFDRWFDRFADSGHDPNGWVVGWKEMEGKVNKKMDRYVTATAALRKEIDELTAVETALRKVVSNGGGDETTSKEQKIADLRQKVFWQRQEVKSLKEKSLWNRSFDGVVSILARSSFTVFARLKLVFGLGHGFPTYLPRSLSASAAVVYPSGNPADNSTDTQTQAQTHSVSGQLTKFVRKDHDDDDEKSKSNSKSFFETNSEMLKPPATTLGAAALALHYANLIIVMEKMIKSPQLVGIDARDDLYAMLPSSVRSALRRRLRGVGFTATDPGLAGEWKDALGRVLSWLSPLAHNMIKWQSERSFEQQNSSSSSATKTTANVMLLQTLYFANKEKAEAAITELLVGLNYIWRFEREMTAKALFECGGGGFMLKSSGKDGC